MSLANWAASGMRNVWEQVLPIKTLGNLDARDESTPIYASTAALSVPPLLI